MGTEWLRKIGTAIELRQDSVFTYPVDKQKAYIAHFPEPRDGIERGFFQYRCKAKLYGQPLHFFMSLSALPLSLYYLASYKDTAVPSEESADAVFFPDGKPVNIVPDSLFERFKNLIPLPSTGSALTKEDRKFLKSIFRRYPFSWLLWMKVIIKVAQYSHAITTYNPKAIISCNEFAFTAPFLTEYCHTRGVKLINVMHGEKLYYMRDTFTHYDEFYVWDQHYVDLLTELRGEEDQFRVELPKSMRITPQDDVSVQYDYTYYFVGESNDTLQTIANILRSLHEKGLRISVRPHPRYSDINVVKQLFGFANIEDCKTVTIERSLLQTGAAVSTYSTVLSQAASSSIPIVIDDISTPKDFEKLKQLKYVCLHKEHKLLSEIM